ncbi:MAG: YceI family protein [Candidatus Marisimplicoccus sp.]|tara:strand:+ start:174 stop:704 length:531 start_codon:yes stop_codon:yes gene_type:complete
MKKTLLFTLLISFNLCSQEFWEIDLNSSFIKYSGKHFLHNWDAQNDEISGLLNIENGKIDKIGVIAKVKDFNSGNSSLDSNAMRVVEALKYPNVIFRSSLIEHNDDKVYLEGFLEFHGIKQNLKVEGRIENLEDQIKITMSFIIKLSDFEIKRPSLLLRKVEDEILVEINLNFYPA